MRRRRATGHLSHGWSSTRPCTGVDSLYLIIHYIGVLQGLCSLLHGYNVRAEALQAVLCTQPWNSLGRDNLGVRSLAVWKRAPNGAPSHPTIFFRPPPAPRCPDIAVVWSKVVLFKQVLDLGYHVHFSDVVRRCGAAV
eukprot:351002-Chlamydomonas_euryale.AAC.8